MCAGAGTSVSSRLSVNSSNLQEDLAIGRPNLDCHPSFYFCFWVLGDDPHHLRGARSSLRSWAGLVDDKSCNVDVDGELLPELAYRSLQSWITRSSIVSDSFLVVQSQDRLKLNRVLQF